MSESSLDFLFDRRSILHFKDEEIPQDVLNKVLVAAQRASAPGGTLTGGYRGAQPISIIVVKNKARRAQLNEMLCEGRKVCIQEAPVSLIFCVDTHRLNRWAALDGGESHFGGMGVLWVSLRAVYTAAQNSVIAAEAMGLGSQYIQEIVWQPHTALDFFELPKQVMPVTMLVLGYPSERPPLAPTLPLEAIVHEETYHDPPDEELLAHYADKEAYYQDWISNLPEDSKLRKHIKKQGVETLAQFVSQVTYTESFYRWRDDMIKINLAVSELE